MDKPDKIYIQTEDQEGNVINDINDLSWCQDRVNDTDAVYVEPEKFLTGFLEHWYKDNPMVGTGKIKNMVDNYLFANLINH